ncbi:hypothetical protein BD289DRAFT_433557 [Coniella lustricola]|uniref:Calcineurin-like phosphoesterase domain-containing protein n=1 Tax=Coniella lustricola TaxID=2025994 RepID=A0A2T3A8J5_9PEZI|nr:hypothetical protein BD289DRAFT_433557 [Coniella lustricola]
MAFGTMLSNATLQRPRSLFGLGILTLCVTLILSYERLRSYAFGPFPDFLSGSSTDDSSASDLGANLVISKTDRLVYQLIANNIGPISYGTAMRPKFKDMPELLIDTLPERFIPSVTSQDLPGAENDASSSASARRLIIIGDIHGQRKALEDLLQKLDFNNNNGDHLIFTGDLINKGPDSAGVVAMAMELGAHSVRGNHEDRVLLAHAAMNRRTQLTVAEAEASLKAFENFQIKEDGDGESDAYNALKAHQAAEDALSKGEERDRETAQALSDEQIKWLAGLPLILRIGSIPLGTEQQQTPALENVLVVHAGLVPKVPLEAQDPWAVMNMRTITYPIDEIRRDAVKSFLIEKAKAQSEGKGGKSRLKALQDVDGDLINTELKKMSISQGFELGNHINEAGLPSEGRDGKPWYEEWGAYQDMLAGKKRTITKRLGKKDVVDEQINGTLTGGEDKSLVEEEEHQDQQEEEQEEEQGEEQEEEEQEEPENEQASSVFANPEPITTIVYGHDAKSGLQVPEIYKEGKTGYTFGLDTGCVYGRSLTALVIEIRNGAVVHDIVQVACDKAVDPDK